MRHSTWIFPASHLFRPFAFAFWASELFGFGFVAIVAIVAIVAVFKLRPRAEAPSPSGILCEPLGPESDGSNLQRGSLERPSQNKV